MPKWTKDFDKLTCIEITPQYFTSSNTCLSDTVLHVFVNASTKAYGTVAYLKSSHEHHSSFVRAKSRIAPTKELTLPQLELTAAMISARLASYRQCQCDVCTVFLWSDRLSFTGFVVLRNLSHLLPIAKVKLRNLPQ